MMQASYLFKKNSNGTINQASIFKYFKPTKGPLKFDFGSSALSKQAVKENKSGCEGSQLSDTKPASKQTKGKNKSRTSKRSKRGRKQVVNDDDDDVVCVREYNLSGESIKIENDIDLSPKIILRGENGDVLFATESQPNTGCDSVSPSKKKKTNEDDHTLMISPAKRLTCSTPITITKSEKQSTVLKMASRILQMNNNNGNTSRIVSLDSVDFSIDGISLNNSDSSDKTVRYDCERPTQNATIADDVTLKYEAGMVKLDAVKAENVDDASDEIKFLQNLVPEITLTCMDDPFNNAQLLNSIDEATERKVKYHLRLIDKIVINACRPHLSNLLFPHESDMLKQYIELPYVYQYFCCKLFTHQLKWYGLSKFVAKINLKLSEDESRRLCECLKEIYFINTDYTSEPSIYLLNLLEVENVKKIHRSLRLNSKGQKKEDLIQSILKHSNTQTTLTSSKSLDVIVREKIYDLLGLRVKLSDSFYNMFSKIHLLYSFTNPEFATPSDLYLFISKIHNGDISLPEIDREEKSIFKDAAEFSRYAKASGYKNELLLEFEKNKKSEYMLELCRVIYRELKDLLEADSNEDVADKPSYVKRFSAGNKYASALSFACAHMTKKYSDEVKDWLELLLQQDKFCERKRGFWYVQLAMLHKTYFQAPQKSVEALLRGLKDTRMSLVDLSELSYVGRRYCVSKKLQDTSELSSLLIDLPQPDDFPELIIDASSNHSNQAGRKSKYRAVNEYGETEYLNVEQVALNHYIREKGFSRGMHCEGALMLTMFCVLFWDIMYSPSISVSVPYAFISELQHLPLDFYSTEFYTNRKDSIDVRINNIKSEWTMEYLQDYLGVVWENMADKKSLVVPGLIQDAREFYDILLCIGRDVTAEICRRLVKNMREFRAGMPDLFLWNATTRRCKFVEVKGPGDTLSMKQKLWLEYLDGVGADIEVCHVHPIGSTKSAKYKRKQLNEQKHELSVYEPVV